MLRAGDVAAVSEAVVAHTQRADAELKAKHASDAWITVRCLSFLRPQLSL